MDKQRKELSKDKLNAGRGVAKRPNPENNNDTASEKDQDDRPDERARKAGY